MHPLELSNHSQSSEESLLHSGDSDRSSRRDTASQRVSSKSPTSLVLWACIGISLSSSIIALSLMLHHQTLRNSTAAAMLPTHVSGTKLRRPNPYVNLDRVYQKGSLPAHPRIPSFYTFPHAVLQIDAADSERAFLPEKHRSYSSAQGFIYPDDRFFEASSRRSTIVQFRNQDFGMENCTLQPTIPDASTTAFDPEAHFVLSSTIEIWMLDNSRELSRHDLWDKAPRRNYLLDEITVDGKGCKECRLHFHCPSASFSTFEFACSGDNSDCLVSFWQRKGTSPNGVYVLQRDSLTLEETTVPSRDS